MNISKYIRLVIIIAFFQFNFPAHAKKECDERKGLKYNSALAVFHPDGYTVQPARKMEFKNSDIVIALYSVRFAQGNAVYVEIYPNPEKKNKEFQVDALLFENRRVVLSRKKWGYRGLFAIPPVSPPGQKLLQAGYSIDGGAGTAVYYIAAEKTAFDAAWTPLDLGEYSDVDRQVKPEIQKRVRMEAAKKKEVFSAMSTERTGVKRSHPRDMHYITSAYFSTRVYMQYRKVNGAVVRLKDQVNCHWGIDLMGRSGDPVYAVTGGRVALAENMYYEGNFVVIDHGSGVFSFYMHMSGLCVKQDDIIEGGTQIGRVGSTGISTGPHLHVSFMIGGIQIDPLSVLSLPFRD